MYQSNHNNLHYMKTSKQQIPIPSKEIYRVSHYARNSWVFDKDPPLSLSLSLFTNFLVDRFLAQACIFHFSSSSRDLNFLFLFHLGSGLAGPGLYLNVRKIKKTNS